MHRLFRKRIQGSNSDPCYIQNRVITNRVIKRFRFNSGKKDFAKISVLYLPTSSELGGNSSLLKWACNRALAFTLYTKHKGFSLFFSSRLGSFFMSCGETECIQLNVSLILKWCAGLYERIALIKVVDGAKILWSAKCFLQKANINCSIYTLVWYRFYATMWIFGIKFAKYLT